MIRKIYIVSVFISFCFGMDFNEFKQMALKNNPYLSAVKLKKDTVNEETKILTRYKNPSINLEFSNFDVTASSNGTGYAAFVNQPVRLWGVYDAKKGFADAKTDEIEKQLSKTKALFVRDLSLLYVDYKTISKIYDLSLEMLEITKKILDITKQRYQNGTISKAKYFQAEVTYNKFKNSVFSIEIKKQESFYNLLKFAKIKKDIQLQTSYSFKIKDPNKDTANSYDIAYLSSKIRTSKESSKIFSNKIEWSELYLGFEKEPDRKIIRAGFNIPIAVFNKKDEEKALSLLKAKKYELLKDAKQTELDFELKKIKTNLKNLQKLKNSTKELIASQEKLLDIYEESYKIANTDIIELQIIQNNLISSKLKLIKTQSLIEKNIINYNYITGADYE